MTNDKKTIKTPAGYELAISTIPYGYCACAGCGKPLERNKSLVVICPDCGAMFCEDCATNGTFDDHDCEVEDLP